MCSVSVRFVIISIIIIDVYEANMSAVRKTCRAL